MWFKSRLQLNDKKVAKVIRDCEEIDDQYLFSYLEDDQEQRITSTDVNEYLHDIAKERVTAKYFRTWWGSVTTLPELIELKAGCSNKVRETACREAIKVASQCLGNTVAVCRKSYVHPGMIAAAESDELPALLAKLKREDVDELAIDEAKFKQLLPLLDFS